MTRYFFDLKDGVRIRDHDGIKFESDAEAIAHAHVVAKEVAKGRPLPDPNEPPMFVSIIHADGRQVDKVLVPVATDAMQTKL